MAGPIKQAGQTARDLAIKAAKQMAREPLEVLNTAKEQTTGSSEAPQNPEQPKTAQTGEVQKPQSEVQMAQKDKAQSERLMQALAKELTEIEHQDVFSKLQSKIASGEKVAIEEYPELSREQRDVLAAQMKAVAEQKAAQAARMAEAPPIISSKPARGKMGPSKKQEAEKQQQRVEKPVPPSG